MKQWLFNLTAAISLAACVGTVMLWVRSYRQPDWVYHYWSEDRIYIVMISVRGRICCIRNRGGYPPFQNPYNQLYEGPSRETELVPQLETGGIAGFNLGVAPGWWSGKGPDSPHTEAQFRSLFHRSPFPPLQVPAGANLEKSLYIVVPHWLAVVLTIPLPAYWFLKLHRRARRIRSGCCPVCGYDLRATPERCPECGTSPASAGSSAKAGERG